MSAFHRIAMTPPDDPEGKHNNLILLAALDDEGRIIPPCPGSPGPYMIASRWDDGPWFGCLVRHHLGMWVISWGNNGSAPDSITDFHEAPMNRPHAVFTVWESDQNSEKRPMQVRYIKPL
jgi:hypothetical protein